MEMLCNMDKMYHLNTNGVSNRRIIFVYDKKAKRYNLMQ